MPTLVHEFDWPDRVVVGTVGRPGARTFYLQVRTGARTAQVVIEAYPYEPDDAEDTDDAPFAAEPAEPSEMLLVRIPVGTARAFVQRTRRVVRAGRPTCPLCGRPVDEEGHVCAPPDGR
jgi:uncharacterized repeat protein (TIGR03847 family)